MNPAIGTILLLLALFSTGYALVMSLRGARNNDEMMIESARNAAIITLPLLTLASLLLISFLVSGQFYIEYVWSVSDRAMPTYLKATALWGGQPGSLLFWSWLMSLFTTGALLRNWQREHKLMPYVIGASMGTLGFFILLVVFWENPFAHFYQTSAGEVIATMFGPSNFLWSISNFFLNLGERLPGLIGIIFKGLIPLAPPVGSFSLIGQVPDGQGLNPLLRHPGMVIHPPMLYLGFVGFVVPYSFAMAALIRGETDPSWIHATRRWTLIAWLFLSLGLILGGWWAYDVLGWGGYWAWDPVENAALLPWLTGTAFLHSVMIQEKRGMLRRWNMVLIILTYLLVIMGTFATRSGFVSSVHSFAQSAIGPLFFLFLISALFISVVWLINRWEEMQDDYPLDSLFSRETIFLLQNLIFVSLTLAVFIGTYWPVVTELLSGIRSLGIEKSSLGPTYYNKTTGPMWLALVFLMGIAPLIAWKKASLKRVAKSMMMPTVAALIILTIIITLLAVNKVINPFQAFIYGMLGYAITIESFALTGWEYHRGAYSRVKAHDESYPVALLKLFGRNRRRYGGYLIHFGVLVMALGIISSNVFQLETQKPLAAGQIITLGDYQLEYETLERFVATDGRSVWRARTIVYKNGKEVDRLTPRMDIYPGGQPMSIPGKHTNLRGDDFYVLLVTWEQLDLSSATFRVYINPLVNWVWIGSFIFILGTGVAAWPDFSEDRRLAAARGDAGSRRMAPVAGK